MYPVTLQALELTSDVEKGQRWYKLYQDISKKENITQQDCEQFLAYRTTARDEYLRLPQAPKSKAAAHPESGSVKTKAGAFAQIDPTKKFNDQFQIALDYIFNKYLNRVVVEYKSAVELLTRKSPEENDYEVLTEQMKADRVFAEKLQFARNNNYDYNSNAKFSPDQLKQKRSFDERFSDIGVSAERNFVAFRTKIQDRYISEVLETDKTALFSILQKLNQNTGAWQAELQENHTKINELIAYNKNKITDIKAKIARKMGQEADLPTPVPQLSGDSLLADSKIVKDVFNCPAKVERTAAALKAHLNTLAEKIHVGTALEKQLKTAVEEQRVYLALLSAEKTMLDDIKWDEAIDPNAPKAAEVPAASPADGLTWPEGEIPPAPAFDLPLEEASKKPTISVAETVAMNKVKNGKSGPAGIAKPNVGEASQLLNEQLQKRLADMRAKNPDKYGVFEESEQISKKESLLSKIQAIIPLPVKLPEGEEADKAEWADPNPIVGVPEAPPLDIDPNDQNKLVSAPVEIVVKKSAGVNIRLTVPDKKLDLDEIKRKAEARMARVAPQPPSSDAQSAPKYELSEAELLQKELASRRVKKPKLQKKEILSEEGEDNSDAEAEAEAPVVKKPSWEDQQKAIVSKYTTAEILGTAAPQLTLTTIESMRPLQALRQPNLVRLLWVQVEELPKDAPVAQSAKKQAQSNTPIEKQFLALLRKDQLLQQQVVKAADNQDIVMPSTEAIKRILAVQAFCAQKQSDLKENSKLAESDKTVYGRCIDMFYTAALSVCLSDEPAADQKEKLNSLAHEWFPLRDYYTRLLRDTLVMISCLFLVGLAVGFNRVKHGQTWFLCQEPSVEEMQFREAITVQP